jgi:hypothetical protein
MIGIAHEPNKKLRTIKHPLFALTPRVSSPERAMRVVEIEVGDCLPYTVNLIRWKWYLLHVTLGSYLIVQKETYHIGI